jgi:hypothetical protein
LPIIAVHVFGLPLAIFVLVRMMAAVLDLRRRIPGRTRSAPLAAVPANPAAVQRAPPTRPAKKVEPRAEFGLRKQTTAGR